LITDPSWSESDRSEEGQLAASFCTVTGLANQDEVLCGTGEYFGQFNFFLCIFLQLVIGVLAMAGLGLKKGDKFSAKVSKKVSVTQNVQQNEHFLPYAPVPW
jgi:hypothetical protein